MSRVYHGVGADGTASDVIRRFSLDANALDQPTVPNTSAPSSPVRAAGSLRVRRSAQGSQVGTLPKVHPNRLESKRGQGVESERSNGDQETWRTSWPTHVNMEVASLPGGQGSDIETAATLIQAAQRGQQARKRVAEMQNKTKFPSLHGGSVPKLAAAGGQVVAATAASGAGWVQFDLEASQTRRTTKRGSEKSIIVLDGHAKNKTRNKTSKEYYWTSDGIAWAEKSGAFRNDAMLHLGGVLTASQQSIMNGLRLSLQKGTDLGYIAQEFEWTDAGIEWATKSAIFPTDNMPKVGSKLDDDQKAVLSSLAISIGQALSEQYIKQAARDRGKSCGLKSLSATMDKLQADEQRVNKRSGVQRRKMFVAAVMMSRGSLSALSDGQRSEPDEDTDACADIDAEDSGKSSHNHWGMLRSALWLVLLHLHRKSTGDDEADSQNGDGVNEEAALKKVFAVFCSKRAQCGASLMTSGDFSKFGKVMSKLGAKMKGKKSSEGAREVYDERLQLQVDMAWKYNLKRTDASKGLCYEVFQALLNQLWHYNMDAEQFQKFSSIQ